MTGDLWARVMAHPAAATAWHWIDGHWWLLLVVLAVALLVPHPDHHR